jgi:hypothetical protein
VTQIGARLAELLQPSERPAFLKAFADVSAAEGFTTIEQLVDRLVRDNAGLTSALADRTLQLRIALGVLGERDKAAAEQSGGILPWSCR